MYIENRAQSLATITAHALSVMQGDNQSHADMWESVIESVNAELPKGSGFDSGSSLDIDQSKPSRLVFATSYHHMNDVGMYDGWSDHLVILTPSFDGFDIRVTGRNRNGIKDYIAECFHEILRQYFVTKATRDESGLRMDIRKAAFDFGFVKES